MINVIGQNRILKIFLLVFIEFMVLGVVRAKIVDRHVQYSFSIQNPTNQFIPKIKFWTYAPVKETATQKCEKIESPSKYQLIKDEWGNQILEYELNNLAPYGTKIIQIKAVLKISVEPLDMKLENRHQYLSSQKFQESDSRDIIQLANKVSQGLEPNQAKLFYRWIVSNIKDNGYVQEEKGALHALERKEGDCTEQAYLFTALCRARNIPSRTLGGYVCSSNRVLKPFNYHNWAEFYNNKTWLLSDPQSKKFIKKASDYIAFRVIGESKNNPIGTYHRFRVQPENINVKMNV